MSTNFENAILQHLAELKKTAAELERELSDSRPSHGPELVRSGYEQHGTAVPAHETFDCLPEDDYGRPEANGAHDVAYLDDPEMFSAAYAAPNSGGVYDAGEIGDQPEEPDERTTVLINHGRRSVYHRRLSPAVRKGGAGAVVTALVIAIVAVAMSRGGASWPSSVAVVQNEITKACENPDVKSEPGQVNFACGKSTRQILWVFALMTSAANANFVDSQTGRQGLEPITPAQGGEVAASLNLHHPYDPADPVDSLQVAARAINNIVGGATLTGPSGKPIVQPGLESNPSNCLRYTGSAAVISRQGFPAVCAKPVSSTAGQAALVADVYRKWLVGTTPEAAQAVAVLYENAKNPGDPRVQFILKHLPDSPPQA